MPPRSSIAALPKQVKEWLDTSLVDGNFSGYQQLEAELEKHGFKISKSAIHRYGQQFEERIQTLKMASEQAKAIVTAAPDDEGAVNEALMRLVQEKLFQVMLDFEVDPNKPLNLASAAKAIAELGRASVTQKKYAAEVRAAAQIAADKVEKIARKGGLSGDAVQIIRKEILGIA